MAATNFKNLDYKALGSIVAGDFVLVPTETKDLERAIEILEKLCRQQS